MRIPVAALLLLAAVAAAAEPVRLTVLHTNDLHGQLRPLPPSSMRPVLRGKRAGGFAHLATMVRNVRKEAAADGSFVLLLDGGDLFQGTPLGNETKGDAVVDVMNALGYDAVAVGNHEFDYGLENFERLGRRARFPFLAANAAGIARPLKAAKPYVLFAPPKAPCRVAVIGLITPATPWVTTPGIDKHVRFSDPASVVRALLKEVRADLFVLVTHLGRKDDLALAKEIPEIALIVGGHSHTPMHAEVDGVHVVQTHGKGMTLGRIDLDLDPGSWKVTTAQARLLPVDPEATDADPAVAKIIADHDRRLGAQLRTVVGRLVKPARRRRSGGSTTAGNWLADVIREAGTAQVGIMNKGGIRASLEAGEITGEDIYRIMPFDNTVVAMDLTGAQLKSLIAQSMRNARFPGLEWSGLFVDVVRKGKTLEITALTVGGAAVLDSKTYRVATNSFLAAGGDGFAQFKRGKNRARTGRRLRDAIADHLRRNTPYSPPDEKRLRVSARIAAPTR